MPLSIRFLDKDGFKDLLKFTQSVDEDIKDQVFDLGEQTASKMKDVVNQNKVRPQAGEHKDLEENIAVEHFKDGGWGVGDIERLNEKAEYWRAVNFGSSHMVGKLVPKGQFAPGDAEPNPQNSREGRWKKGSGKFMFRVKNPIPAMNYIEKTLAFVKQKFSSIRIRLK